MGSLTKSSAKGLQTILNQVEEPIVIMADGRQLWRIFENLLNNIAKYAMPNTRVYIDLQEKNGKAVMTFKNISEYPLNISADELTERFTRGMKAAAPRERAWAVHREESDRTSAWQV